MARVLILPVTECHQVGFCSKREREDISLSLSFYSSFVFHVQCREHEDERITLAPTHFWIHLDAPDHVDLTLRKWNQLLDHSMMEPDSTFKTNSIVSLCLPSSFPLSADIIFLFTLLTHILVAQKRLLHTDLTSNFRVKLTIFFFFLHRCLTASFSNFWGLNLSPDIGQTNFTGWSAGHSAFPGIRHHFSPLFNANFAGLK